MARKRRCSLCGAKLSGDICRECGYNNAPYNRKVNEPNDGCTHSSSEKYYSGSDHQEHMDPNSGSYTYQYDWQEDLSRWETPSSGGSSGSGKIKDPAKEEKRKNQVKKDNRGEKEKQREKNQTGSSKQKGKTTASAQKDSWDYSQVLEQYDEAFEKTYSSPNKQTVTYGLNEKRKRSPRNKKKKKTSRWIWLILILWFFGGQIGALLEELGDADWIRVIESFWEDDEPSAPSPEELTEKKKNDWYTAVEQPIEDQTEAGTIDLGKESAVLPGAVSSSDTQDRDMETEAGIQTSGTLEMVQDKKFETELKAGNYVAGIHFPTGIYQVFMEKGSGSVYINNARENYWDMAYRYGDDSSEGSGNLKEARLTEGTLVRITDSLRVKLTTMEAEGYLLNRMQAAPSSGTTTDHAVEGGKDLTAGTYTLRWKSGNPDSASVLYVYSEGDDYETYDTFQLHGAESGVENVILGEGDVLIPMNCTVILEPAEYELLEYRE